MCLDPAYTSGCINLLISGLQLTESLAYIAGGKLALYQEGAPTPTLHKWAAAELGSILNVKLVFESALEVGEELELALAFQPFDLEWWKQMSDDALTKTMAPIAQVLDKDAG